MKKLILKKHEDNRIKNGHLWIYSNEVDTSLSPFKHFIAGDLVQVINSNNKILGIAYINPKILICARMLTTNPHEIIDTNFFMTRIKKALCLRDNIFTKPFYRLIFGESDLLPGLIVDRYNTVLVVQFNTAGIENYKNIIIDSLLKVINPETVILRNDNAIRTIESLDLYKNVIYGTAPDVLYVEENDIIFQILSMEGQKTGWFYDQRLNRKRLIPYVKNKKVLDLCSYCGGFGITALVNHAIHATCVDISISALNMLKINADYHKIGHNITLIQGDVFNILNDLKASHEIFDVIILDPPAFIKKNKDIDNGIRAYIRLHCMALKILQKNGILCTSSCSFHLSGDMFLDIIHKTMQIEKRHMVIIEQLHQSQDHPIHPYIPQTNYLKGFIIQCL